MDGGQTKVLVLGGGLSGLTAASSLADSGRFDITVVEGGKLLGGQARGWEDADGDPVETGIHILFPWYHNLVALFERLGRPLPLVPTDGHYHILDGTHKDIVVFKTSEAFLANLSAIYKYPRLSLGDKIRFLRIVFEAVRLSPEAAERYDGWTVRAFLMSRKASPELIAFLETATITIQGLFGWEASAASFLKFLRHLFGSQSSIKPSFFSEPTHLCMVKPLVDCIERGGGTLRTDERVEQIQMNGSSVSEVRTTNDTYRDFDIVLCALPAYVLPKILPDEVHTELAQLCRFQSAYVICAQLQYDRLVFPHGNVFVSNRQGVVFDSVVDKTFHWPCLGGEKSLLQVLIDNGRDLRNASDETIMQRVQDDLATFFPETSKATLLKHTVLRHDAIYTETRPSYWSGVMRSTETFVDNLMVAGEWTAGAYHYGLESAVIAGIRAANTLRARQGLPTHEIKKAQFPELLQR